MYVCPQPSLVNLYLVLFTDRPSPSQDSLENERPWKKSKPGNEKINYPGWDKENEDDIGSDSDQLEKEEGALEAFLADPGLTWFMKQCECNIMRKLLPMDVILHR